MGRSRDDAYVSSSSPGGGTGGEVCRTFEGNMCWPIVMYVRMIAMRIFLPAAAADADECIRRCGLLPYYFGHLFYVDTTTTEDSRVSQ